MRTQVMQKQNSPLMQVWEREGPECPEQWGQRSGRDPPGCPQLSAPQQTPLTHRERSRWVARVSPAPRHRHPHQQPQGSAAVSLRRGQEEILGQLSQEPIQVICTAQRDGIREFCVCMGSWNCSGWEPGPVFHRTRSFSSPPRVGLTHPCHIHPLPPALPSWDQSSVGAGRSPQDAALRCVHLSLTVPSPQEQGHPGGAARGGPGSAQPG